jgi:hypothetical protein
VRGDALATEVLSLVDRKSGEKLALRRDGPGLRVWCERLAPNSVREFKTDTAAAAAPSSGARPDVKLDSSGWPLAATWPGMRKPLFESGLGDFLHAGFNPPADRRTIAQLHANPDAAKRAEIRSRILRQSGAEYGQAEATETPHTLVYRQEIRHGRLEHARRTVELWKREPRAHVALQFDRRSSVAPELFYVAFTLPAGVPLPRFSCGGVPFTPYRDQLQGSCRDYLGIDGWAHYPTADGHWLWVTRDAPLVAVGGPHPLERHQDEPREHNRIVAMVFDNCWHTNFVADSHGTMEFRFDLAWKESIAKPEDLAEALAGEPVAFHQAFRESPALIKNLFRP